MANESAMLRLADANYKKADAKALKRFRGFYQPGRRISWRRSWRGEVYLARGHVVRVDGFSYAHARIRVRNQFTGKEYDILHSDVRAITW